jgi:hypothetical protein
MGRATPSLTSISPAVVFRTYNDRVETGAEPRSASVLVLWPTSGPADKEVTHMKSGNFSRRFLVVILAAFVSCVAAWTTAAAAPVAAGACATTATRYKVQTVPQPTTSMAYVNVIDSRIDFIQGGARATCVIVLFSAEASAGANTALTLLPIIDGENSCEPSESVFLTSGAGGIGTATHAVTFVCEDVAPGSHVVRLKFRSANGTTVTLGARSILVHYVR